MITFDKAKKENIEALVDKSMEFISHAYKSIPPNKEDIKSVLLDAIDNNLVYIAKRDEEVKGLMCFAVSPCVMNFDVMMAVELIYWLDTDTRKGMTAIKFLRYVEGKLSELGIHRLVMVYLETSVNMTKLYERMGYTKVETSFIKGIQ